jgi:hypothetical protein
VEDKVGLIFVKDKERSQFVIYKWHPALYDHPEDASRRAVLES